MCGICGVVNTAGAPIEDSRLRRMRDLLSHRGPDDAGVWSADGVGLGHRRLSIIDLSSGHQPLSNETGTVWVTFNGEIYNYRELRNELVRAGHEFRTNSDTEVLVHGYEEWGTDLPSRLNGIFAFGVYDTTSRRLFLARDQLGVKPLFYGQVNSEFAFASETPSVLSVLGMAPRLSRDALIEYLIFRYLAGEQTFFEGVRRLAAGHYACWEDGKLSVHQYWSPSRFEPLTKVGAGEAAEEFGQRLSTAVSRQLMSDVPLGAFCSGGIDSGLTTYYAVQHSTKARFRTYSVGVPYDEFDETSLALVTARSLDTSHNTIVATADDVRRGLSDLVGWGYEPLSHPNMVPLRDLSALAKKDVTVVLTGEGADELFCGYPRYHIGRIHARVPRMLRGPARATLSALPGHRAEKLKHAMGWSSAEALIFNSAFIDPVMAERLVGRAIDSALDHRRAILLDNTVPGDAVASLSRYEVATYLVSALERLDRVSMASGLEARVPFLDIDLVEWGLRLPTSRKVEGRTNKVTVKRAAAGILDPRVIRGRKSGFGLPLGIWIRDGAFTDITNRMLTGDHPASEYLDPAVVRRVTRDHMDGIVDNGEMLWLIMNLFLWFERNTESVASDAVQTYATTTV